MVVMMIVILKTQIFQFIKVATLKIHNFSQTEFWKKRVLPLDPTYIHFFPHYGCTPLSHELNGLVVNATLSVVFTV
jgi:hypothetical protein